MMLHILLGIYYYCISSINNPANGYHGSRFQAVVALMALVVIVIIVVVVVVD